MPPARPTKKAAAKKAAAKKTAAKKTAAKKTAAKKTAAKKTAAAEAAEAAEAPRADDVPGQADPPVDHLGTQEPAAPAEVETPPTPHPAGQPSAPQAEEPQGDEDDGGNGNGGSQSTEDAARVVIESLREESDVNLRGIGKTALLLYAGITAAFILVQLSRGGTDIKTASWWTGAQGATITTAATVFLATALLSLLMRGTGGLRRLIIGKDGRFSTSLTQAALWTLALSYGLLYLLLRANFCSGPTVCVSTKSAFDGLDATYLFLLGGPFAAAAAAKVAVTTKVSAGTMQRVPATEASARDVLTDDDGRADLVDTQFFMFNVLALVYFAAAFIHKPTELPSLPDGLVALTSLGALTYATNKALVTNAPVITAVKRVQGTGPLRPGDVVDILGANFVPAGASRVEYLTLVSVRFGDVTAALGPATHLESGTGDLCSTRLRATIPEGLTADRYDVTVITAAGVTSNAVKVEVVDDVPTLTAVSPPKVKPGETVRVIGTFLTSNLVPGRPFVNFDGVRVPAHPNGRNHAGHIEHFEVAVPASLQPGNVDVTIVTAAGDESEPIPLEVSPPER